jgi:hypothetical protein
MSYKSLEQQQQAVEAAKYENAKRQTRIQVYQKYGNPRKGGVVIPCDANDKRITDIVDRWLDHNPDVLHSLELFEQAIAANPTDFNSLAKDSEGNVREQLIDQIIGLLATKGKAHDDFSLKSERTRLKTFTIPMLRARLVDLQTKAHMAGQSMQQLKQVVADARPVPGVPMLPKQLFENGVTRNVDASYLKALDPYNLRRMCRIYSLDAVNQRIAEG